MMRAVFMKLGQAPTTCMTFITPPQTFWTRRERPAIGAALQGLAELRTDPRLANALHELHAPDSGCLDTVSWDFKADTGMTLGSYIEDHIRPDVVGFHCGSWHR